MAICCLLSAREHEMHRRGMLYERDFGMEKIVIWDLGRGHTKVMKILLKTICECIYGHDPPNTNLR